MSRGAPATSYYRTVALESDLGEMQVEMPRFNDEYHARPYCFVYAMGDPVMPKGTAGETNHLIKANLCHGKTPSETLPEHAETAYWHEANHYPSESIFVPRPNATDEDDGVLLAMTLDGERALSYLLVLVRPAARPATPRREPCSEPRCEPRGGPRCTRILTLEDFLLAGRENDDDTGKSLHAPHRAIRRSWAVLCTHVRLSGIWWTSSGQLTHENGP